MPCQNSLHFDGGYTLYGERGFVNIGGCRRSSQVSRPLGVGSADLEMLHFLCRGLAKPRKTCITHMIWLGELKDTI